MVERVGESGLYMELNIDRSQFLSMIDSVGAVAMIHPRDQVLLEPIMIHRTSQISRGHLFNSMSKWLD